jgi:hypothetical protein
MTLAVNIAQGGSNNVTFRNKLINGAMNVWQRATSYSVSGAYSYGAADRWASTNSSGSTNSRSTDVPTGFQYSYSIAASSASYPGIAQRVESVNCADLVGQSVTLSCWIKKSSGTTEVDAALYYANSADTFSSITQIGSTAVLASSPTSTWTKYTCTFTNLPANAVNGLQISIFTLSASTSDTLLITGVQLEAGTTASPFEYRQYGTELALCQRYFEKNAAQGTAPQQGLGPSGQVYGGGMSAFGASNARTPRIRFAVTKRTAPSITFYRSASGQGGTVDGQFSWYNGGAWLSSTSTTLIDSYTQDNEFGVDLASSSGYTSGYSYLWGGTWTASAEL